MPEDARFQAAEAEDTEKVRDAQADRDDWADTTAATAATTGAADVAAGSGHFPAGDFSPVAAAGPDVDTSPYYPGGEGDALGERASGTVAPDED